MLTKRDKLIINTLKHQESYLYKGIKNKFFPSRFLAEKNLKRLVDSRYISFEPLEKKTFKRGVFIMNKKLWEDLKRGVGRLINRCGHV